jgi:hypothetical protein
VTQDWDKANSSQTAIPFERQYTLSDEPSVPVLKQNVGMFMLSSGAEVHIQSFGIFNLTLWDDVFAQFEPLTERDTILVGEILHLQLPAVHLSSAGASTGKFCLCAVLEQGANCSVQGCVSCTKSGIWPSHSGI